MRTVPGVQSVGRITINLWENKFDISDIQFGKDGYYHNGYLYRGSINQYSYKNRKPNVYQELQNDNTLTMIKRFKIS